jgi:hypothetical protein
MHRTASADWRGTAGEDLLLDDPSGIRGGAHKKVRASHKRILGVAVAFCGGIAGEFQSDGLIEYPRRRGGRERIPRRERRGSAAQPSVSPECTDLHEVFSERPGVAGRAGVGVDIDAANLSEAAYRKQQKEN